MQDLAYFPILPLVFVLSLGLSIGLTFLPCYSGLCVETFHPFSARVHIATFYGLLASVALVLAARVGSGTVRNLSETYLIRATVPLLGKRVSFGAALFALWALGITLATTGYWWPQQRDFYEARGLAVDWTVGTLQLAITGVTGHHCDIAVGLMVLPVARDSLLARVFRLQQSTLLFAHKIISYVALLAVIAHGVTYYSWIPHFAAANDQRKNTFEIDNPTITLLEAEARGPWGFIVLPSGGFSLVCFLIIVLTSLPKQRRLRYNVFYYTHVIVGSLFFFLICIHASTDFYFLLPGLSLWLLDLVMRLRWLRKNSVEARLENAGHGWYRIRIPASRSQESCEQAVEQPLQAFYLNFPTVSKLQCHAFTASATSQERQGPSFLFRRVEGKKEEKLKKEWTCKLGSLVEGPCLAPKQSDRPSISLPLRLEGPYATPSEPLFSASRVLCLVGGTGITGALSLANAWLRHRGLERNARFRLVWTVRTSEAARVAEVNDLRGQMAARSTNMEMRVHVSREAGRIDSLATLSSFFQPVDLPQLSNCAAAKPSNSNELAGEEKVGNRVKPSGECDQGASGWVYCSGPAGLLNATDAACLGISRQLRTRSKVGNSGLEKLECYCAKWEV